MSAARRQQLGEKRETWCAVEKMNAEDFTRAQRKHYGIHLQTSEASGQAAEIPAVSRCEWKPENPKLKERKHFKHTFESCLNQL